MNKITFPDGSPSELILARSQAFQRGDFGSVFDSCHSESNFRRQFAERDDYVDFARSSLGQDYQINSCLILDERVDDQESQVIFLMHMTYQGVAQNYAELAWLRMEDGGWRYHRGQKMTAEELPEDPQSLSFADFAKLDPSTIF